MVGSSFQSFIMLDAPRVAAKPMIRVVSAWRSSSTESLRLRRKLQTSASRKPDVSLIGAGEQEDGAVDYTLYSKEPSKCQEERISRLSPVLQKENGRDQRTGRNEGKQEYIGNRICHVTHRLSQMSPSSMNEIAVEPSRNV